MKLDVSWIGFRWKGIFDKMDIEHKYGKVSMFVLGPIVVTFWR